VGLVVGEGLVGLSDGRGTAMVSVLQSMKMKPALYPLIYSVKKEE
jgi:hypothetical protein